MRSIRLVGVAGVAAVTLGVVGCGAFDEVRVELSSQASVYQTEVGACVELAGLSTLREDIGSFSTLTIRAQSVEQEIVSTDLFRYSVSGETEVRTSRTDVYDWTCESVVNMDSASLQAKILDFEMRLPKD